MAEKRRMRVRRKASKVIPPCTKDIDKLNGLLYSIASVQEDMQALSAQDSLMRAEAFKEMKRLGLKEHINGRCDAEIVRPAGRSKTEIDPREYHEALAEDEEAFYDSISVSVGKAKEHLSGKELSNVSRVTPAKSGEPTLKLKVTPTHKDVKEEADKAA